MSKSGPMEQGRPPWNVLYVQFHTICRSQIDPQLPMANVMANVPHIVFKTVTLSIKTAKTTAAIFIAPKQNLTVYAPVSFSFINIYLYFYIYLKIFS